MKEQDKNQIGKVVVNLELETLYDSLMEKLRETGVTLEDLQQDRINRALAVDKHLENIRSVKRRIVR